jgi:hypothetical protein
MQEASRQSTPLHDLKSVDVELQPQILRGPRSAGTPVPDVWYYVDQRGKVGPLSLEELKRTLVTHPNASDVLVWARHLPDWYRAADVPELGSQPAPTPRPATQAGGPPRLEEQEKAQDEIGPPQRGAWYSMKRAILWGFTSSILSTAILSLINLNPGVPLLLALAISIPVGRAAMKAPPSKSWAHAVAGWLIGFFAPSVVVLLVVLVILGGASLFGQ